MSLSSTPAAVATTSAPAATPAPSAPSTPSTPSAPSTPASTPTPSTTPAAGTPPAAAPDTRSTFEVLRDKVAEAFDPNGKGGEPAKEDKSAEAAKAAETTPEAKTEDKKPQGEQPGEQKVEGEANYFDSYDPTGAIAVDELRASLSEDPALSAALEAKPELKNRIFANARLAERATKYDEIVGSPEEATVAMEGYNALGNIGDLLGSIEDGKPQTIAPFIDAIVQRTALRDENGEMLKRPDGSIITDGSMGKFLKNFYLGEMQADIAEAQAKGDDDYLAALDIVMERKGLRPSTVNNDDSDELKEQRAQLETEKRQLAEQREREATVSTQASNQRVIAATDKVLNSSIDSIMGRATGIKDFERTTVIRNIHNRLAQLIGANRSYAQQRSTIERQPLGQKRETEMTRLNTRFINDNLWKIATDELSKAGYSIATKAEQRQQRQAAREEASKAENKGSLPVAQGGAAQSAPDAQFSLAQIEADLKARNGGRTPSMQEIITEKVLRKQRAAQSATGGTR